MLSLFYPISGLTENSADDDSKAWLEAAGAALREMAYSNKFTIVLNETLPLPAQRALKEWGKTIPLSELPEQEKYILPPKFLRVNKFEKQDNIFEFDATWRSVSKENHLTNCGTTQQFRIKFLRGKGWRQVGSVRRTVC